MKLNLRDSGGSYIIQRKYQFPFWHEWDVMGKRPSCNGKASISRQNELCWYTVARRQLYEGGVKSTLRMVKLGITSSLACLNKIFSKPAVLSNWGTRNSHQVLGLVSQEYVVVTVLFVQLIMKTTSSWWKSPFLFATCDCFLWFQGSASLIMPYNRLLCWFSPSQYLRVLQRVCAKKNCRHHFPSQWDCLCFLQNTKTSFYILSRVVCTVVLS